MKLGGYVEYVYVFDCLLLNVSLILNIDYLVDVCYCVLLFDKDFLFYGLGFNYLIVNFKWNIFGDVVGNVFNVEDY